MIPSVEGPEPLQAVLDEAARLDILDRASGAPLPLLKPEEHLLPVPPRFPAPMSDGNG